MTKLFPFFILFNLMCLELLGQSSMAGRVVDESGKPLNGALVVLDEMEYHTKSGEKGDFILTGLEPKSYTLTVSLIGYHTLRIQATINQNPSLLPDILLIPLSMELEEVTVSDQFEYRKVEESLNIQVISGDFIKRNLGGSLMKSLERIPGINNIGIGSGASKPLIRGLGFNQVVVVDNGIKHEGQQWGADHGLEVDQYAVGRVEIIKGAASFMYGPDAIAGVIAIQPAAIPSEGSLGGIIDVTGKSNNRQYGSSLNLFGRNESWFFNTRLTYMDYGDFRVPTDTVYVYDYAVRLHANQVRNTAGQELDVHGSIGYIGEKIRNTLSSSNVYSKAGFFANAHGLEPRNVDTGLHDASSRDILLPKQEVTHTKIINRTEYSFANNLLELQLGFQKNYRQEWSQYVNHGYMPPIYPENMPHSSTLERQYDKNVYSFNLKNEMFLDKHILTLGANGEWQYNDIGGWGFLIPAFQQSNIGIFAYDKFRLNDKWLLHGALRFDHGRTHIKEYKDWFATDINTDTLRIQENLIRANDLSRTFNSVVWSLGANYTPGAFSFKGNAGTSFRMPIAKELAANGVNYHYFRYEKGDPYLSAERSYQVDIGFGWEGFGWILEASPFFNYFPNFIFLNPTSQHDYYYGAGNQVFYYAQSKVMRYGGELHAKYNFTDQLSMELLGEYVHSEQLSGGKKGYTLPFSPPPSALINISYLPQWSGTIQDPYLTVDYRLIGRQNHIVPPERKTPGYQVLNIGVGSGIDLGKQTITFNLQVQNLLNTRYLNHTSFYRLIELPEMGRNIILSLRIPFSLEKNINNI